MVTFNDSNHTYQNKEGVDYISVTTLIKMYTPPFEADYWSSYKALKDVLSGVGRWEEFKKAAGGWEAAVDFYKLLVEQKKFSYNSQVIAVKNQYLKAWDDKREKSAAKGKIFHRSAEEKTRGSVIIRETLREVEIGYDDPIIEAPDFKSTKVYCEQIIYSHKLQIAGQADWILKDRRDVSIKDYKTSEEIKKVPFMEQTLLYPVNEIPDTNFHKFTLQLSIYAYLLELAGYNPKQLVVEHIISEDDKKSYPVEYLRKQVILLIDDYIRVKREERRAQRRATIQ